MDRFWPRAENDRMGEWLRRFVALTFLRWPLLSAPALLWLASCATQPPSQPARPAINLSGFSAEFRAGYDDGCASVKAARKRDEARFKADANYAQGWSDGYDICRRRQ